VLVDDTEVAVEFILQRDEVLHRAQVVAQGEDAAGLNAGKNGFHGLVRSFPKLTVKMKINKKGPSAHNRDG
jgi:hypothetical protein